MFRGRQIWTTLLTFITFCVIIYPIKDTHIIFFNLRFECVKSFTNLHIDLKSIKGGFIMAKKIFLTLVYIIIGIILIFGLYYLFNGGIENLVSTTREVSFWQAIKDIFVGLFKGIKRTFGGD